MLATCLCPTRNRRQWLPHAIECFQRQTYRDRELLILPDGDDVSDLIPNDPRIRVFPVTQQSIGAKRNIGCKLARGEFIVHFDDDDHSEPTRIEDQIGRLIETGLAVTGYHSMRFTNGKDWYLYKGYKTTCLGTSLCYRFDWWKEHPFQNRQVGEDTEFALLAAQLRQFVAVDPRDLMWASIHPHNTSKSRQSIKLGDSWSAATGDLGDFKWPA